MIVVEVVVASQYAWACTAHRPPRLRSVHCGRSRGASSAPRAPAAPRAPPSAVSSVAVEHGEHFDVGQGGTQPEGGGGEREEASATRVVRRVRGCVRSAGARRKVLISLPTPPAPPSWVNPARGSGKRSLDRTRRRRADEQRRRRRRVRRHFDLETTGAGTGGGGGGGDGGDAGGGGVDDADDDAGGGTLGEDHRADGGAHRRLRKLRWCLPAAARRRLRLALRAEPADRA